MPIFPSSTPALKSATTDISISEAAAPTAGQVLTATSDTAADWQTPDSGGGGGGSPVVDVKLYTADDTWTNPSPTEPRRVFVRLVAAGGGGSGTGAGGAGGNGGGYASGGGGGAAGTDTVGDSGAGGNGAPGYALIITY